MHELLEKLLEKRGVALKDLDEVERADLERMKNILSGKQVDLSSISKFCNAHISMIEKQMDNIGNPDKLNERLILLHSVYRKLRVLVSDVPSGTKEKLEADLTAMIMGE